MAKGAPKRIAGQAALPRGALRINRYAWPVDVPIHRIHAARYAAAQFNDSHAGNARFSPIHDGSGAVIPTLYGGSTFECAAMETVFHDVPYTSGVKQVAAYRFENQVYSTLQCTAPLQLADLSGTGLYKLGVPRSNLIDTEADQYPLTRKWAEAIHAQFPDVQGLCWTSRRDDRALAAVLFEDRMHAADPPCALVQTGASASLLGDADADAAAAKRIYDLAEQLGVIIFPSTTPAGL